MRVLGIESSCDDTAAAVRLDRASTAAFDREEYSVDTPAAVEIYAPDENLDPLENDSFIVAGVWKGCL